MDEKGKMSARNREARAAAVEPDTAPLADEDISAGDEASTTHPTWLDRVRDAAAPEPDEPLWTPEPVGPSDSVWDATDTVVPGRRRPSRRMWVSAFAACGKRPWRWPPGTPMRISRM